MDRRWSIRCRESPFTTSLDDVRLRPPLFLSTYSFEIFWHLAIKILLRKQSEMGIGLHARGGPINEHARDPLQPQSTGKLPLHAPTPSRGVVVCCLFVVQDQESRTRVGIRRAELGSRHTNTVCGVEAGLGRPLGRLEKQADEACRSCRRRSVPILRSDHWLSAKMSHSGLGNPTRTTESDWPYLGR